MSTSDEDCYEIPLKDQRYFGAGIKRKRVHFVPSSTADPSSCTKSSSSGASSASSRYLAVVFSKSRSTDTRLPLQHETESTDTETDHAENTVPVVATGTAAVTVCEICKAPLSTSDKAVSSHTTSLVHQICVPHSHQPSHLDRNRLGLSILGSHGWDPDARRGLGSSGEGILQPVKASKKRDTLGLGHGNAHDEEEAASKLKPKKKLTPRPEIKKLHAGAVRKMYHAERQKDDRLREMFYAHEDVDKYLGG